jgi:hypothetical protein
MHRKDHPPPRLHHPRHHALNAQEDALDIDAEHPIEIGLGDFGRRSVLVGRARVVDQDVDWGFYAGDERGPGGGGGDVVFDICYG